MGKSLKLTVLPAQWLLLEAGLQAQLVGVQAAGGEARAVRKCHLTGAWPLNGARRRWDGSAS